MKFIAYLFFLLFFLLPCFFTIHLHKKKKFQSLKQLPEKVFENATISLSFSAQNSTNVELLHIKSENTTSKLPKVTFKSMEYKNSLKTKNPIPIDESLNPVNQENSESLANNDSNFQSMYSNYFQNYYENLENTYNSQDSGPSLLRNPRLNNHFPEPPYIEIQKQALNPYNNIKPYQHVINRRNNENGCLCKEKRTTFCDCDELEMGTGVLKMPPIVLPIIQPVIKALDVPGSSCQEESGDCFCGGGRGMGAFSRGFDRNQCKCPCKNNENDRDYMKYDRLKYPRYPNNRDNRRKYNNDEKDYGGRGEYHQSHSDGSDNNFKDYDSYGGDYNNEDYYDRDEGGYDEFNNDGSDNGFADNREYYNEDDNERGRYHRRKNDRDSYNRYGEKRQNYEYGEERQNYDRRRNFNENTDDNGNKEDGVNINNANANNANVLAQKNTLNKIDNVYATNVSTTNFNHHIHNYIQGGDFKFKQTPKAVRNQNDCSEKKKEKRIFPDIRIINTLNNQGLLLKSKTLPQKNLSIQTVVPKEVINSIISEKNYQEMDSDIKERENITGILNQGIENTIKELKKNHNTRNRKNIFVSPL